MNEQASCSPTVGGKVANVFNVPPKRVPVLDIDSVMFSIAKAVKESPTSQIDIRQIFGDQVYQVVDKIITRLCEPWVAQLEEDLEDIRQSCMLKIFQNIAAYEGRCKFSSWAWLICRNDLIQKLRSKTRRNTTLTPLYEPSDVDAVASPQDTSHLQYDIANVTRKLAHMYPDSKGIVFGLLGNPDDPDYHVPAKIVFADVAKDTGIGYQEAYQFYQRKVVPFFQEQFA